MLLNIICLKELLYQEKRVQIRLITWYTRSAYTLTYITKNIEAKKWKNDLTPNICLNFPFQFIIIESSKYGLLNFLYILPGWMHLIKILLFNEQSQYNDSSKKWSPVQLWSLVGSCGLWINLDYVSISFYLPYLCKRLLS